MTPHPPPRARTDLRPARRLAAILPAVLVVAGALLSGCSSVGSALQAAGQFVSGAGSVRTRLTRITVVATADANRTSATAVDIVFIHDAKVADLLPKDAADWFARRAELRANLWRFLDIVSLELPPAYLVNAVDLPERASTAIQVVAYANMLDQKGRKAIDLTQFKHALLTVKARQVAYAESPEASP